MKPISFEAVNRFARGEVRGSFSKPIRNRAGNKFVRGGGGGKGLIFKVILKWSRSQVHQGAHFTLGLPMPS